MADRIIEARVIQKIATEAEWNEITLVPYKGEVCLVSDSGGKVVNIKIGDGINTFPNLEYMFDSIQQNVGYIAIESNALPTPEGDVAWGMVTEGTYTFGGDDAFTVPDGHWGIANYSSGAWSLVDMGELPVPTGTNVITPTGNDLTNEEAIRNYSATKAELKDSIDNALTQTTPMSYSGTLPYRYYNNTNGETDYQSASSDVSQTNDSTSDTFSINGSSGNVDNTAYFDINKFIEVSQEKTIVYQATINSHDGFFGLGVGYEAGGNVRGVLYSQTGVITRSSPRNRTGAITGFPTLTTGDIVRIEVDIRSSTNQTWRFYKNGFLVYEGGIGINVPTPPSINSKWWLVLKGYEVSVSVDKLSELSNKFPTFTDVENMINPQDPILQRFKVLPDRPTAAPSGGFTCTGLDMITRGDFAGCWIAGNDGRTLEGDSSPYTPEVLILDADFNRILRVIPMPYSGASVQGVTVDTSGSVDTFWVATAGNGTIRHFNLDGTEIESDRFNWNDTYPGLGNPNALAYDLDNHAVWCCPENTQPNNAKLISCDSELPDREIRTITIPRPDQFNKKGNLLYYTYGGNGSNGNVGVYNLDTNSNSDKYLSLNRAQAIEGLYIDDIQGMMYIMNDGGYHYSANPALNIVLSYRV